MQKSNFPRGASPFWCKSFCADLNIVDINTVDAITLDLNIVGLNDELVLDLNL